MLSSRVDPLPSTRIACLNLMPHLGHAGFDTEILWEPPAPREVPINIRVDDLLRGSAPVIVVLQKIRGPAVVKTVRALRERGVRTVWCVCDIVDNEMVSETDATLAVTEFLRGLYDPALQNKIHVVHDGIEDDSLVASLVAKAEHRPRAVMITSEELNAIPIISVPPRGWRVQVVGQIGRAHV